MTTTGNEPRFAVTARGQIPPDLAEGLPTYSMEEAEALAAQLFGEMETIHAELKPELDTARIYAIWNRTGQKGSRRPPSSLSAKEKPTLDPAEIYARWNAPRPAGSERL